jgi:DNA-binding NarL/FixJ family response regulator
MKILIADDHPLFRRAVRQLLADAFADAEFGEAANAEEALQQIRQRDWQIVLLDVFMPGRSGLDILRDIRALKPCLPVLILTAYGENEFAVRVLESGADGFLTKDAPPEDLLTALRNLTNGHKFISPAVAECLANRLRSPHAGPAHENLSDREYEVLCQFAQGHNSSRIARELRLSPKTVQTYRRRLLQKLDLHSTGDLVRYAVEHHLIPTAA